MQGVGSAGLSASATCQGLGLHGGALVQTLEAVVEEEAKQGFGGFLSEPLVTYNPQRT